MDSHRAIRYLGTSDVEVEALTRLHRWYLSTYLAKHPSSIKSKGAGPASPISDGRRSFAASHLCARTESDPGGV